MKGSATCGAVACETKSNWLSTIRGRLGMANDRSLMYLTGGGAFGNIAASRTGIGMVSGTSTGWTVGGGLEYAMQGNMSVKLEYLYVDLGKIDCGGVCGVAAGTGGDVSFKTNLIRAGLNFKFGGGPLGGPISARF